MCVGGVRGQERGFLGGRRTSEVHLLSPPPPTHPTHPPLPPTHPLTHPTHPPSPPTHPPTWSRVCTMPSRWCLSASTRGASTTARRAPSVHGVGEEEGRGCAQVCVCVCVCRGGASSEIQRSRPSPHPPANPHPPTPKHTHKTRARADGEAPPLLPLLLLLPACLPARSPTSPGGSARRAAMAASSVQKTPVRPMPAGAGKRVCGGGGA